jgi:hypothetical protein
MSDEGGCRVVHTGNHAFDSSQWLMEPECERVMMTGEEWEKLIDMIRDAFDSLFSIGAGRGYRRS